MTTTETRFARLDDILASLTLEEKLELNRRVRVGALTLQEGDPVQAARRLRGSYIHEGLEDEGEDAWVHYDVAAGTPGRIVRVKQHVTPFPYVVIFEDGEELSLAATGDVERTG
ncbi:hypothetical protein ACH4S8_37305 [Streptomyces sp. NPDC021080]|uniref:hypothetical protein n=1 Tax=Streptomyces sp. NPDC021080 TaxID=3365110 RepID=UPI00378DDBD3